MAFRDQVSSIVQEILADSTQWPAEMSYAIPQLVAQSPAAFPQIAGDLLVAGTNTSPVTTTGTTFAGGADLLSTALSFTAQGGNSYLVRATAPYWTLSVTATNMFANLNLDGADAGEIHLGRASATAGGVVPFSIEAPFTPSNGSHTLNVRVYAGGASTLTVGAGGGGAATLMPIRVSVYRI